MNRELLNRIPIPKNTSLFVVKNQTTGDILNLVKRGVRDSKNQAKMIAWYFAEGDKVQTCYNVWKFLKENIRYEKESKEMQTVKTLSRLLLQDKKGDCKHFSTATASLLQALEIPFVFRLVSFSFYDKNPSHIFVVAKINGEEIPIDCVLNQFNSEPKYKHKTDSQCR